MFINRIDRKLWESVITLLITSISINTLISSCSFTESKQTAELAVTQFHKQIASQECAAIYEQANVVLKQNVAQKEFIAFCLNISRRLGKLRKISQTGFNIEATVSETLVTLTYEIESDKVSAQEHFIWSIHDDKTSLWQYHIDFQPSKLHLAAREGEKSTVEGLIKSGANINAKDPDGASVIQHAARSGNNELVEFLIQHGANLNDPDDYGVTPLNWAAISGNTTVLNLLISNGADIKQTKSNNGNNLLHDAAYSCNKDMIELVISKGKGVDLKAKNDAGFTALHSAALCKQKEVIEFLISKGLDINAKSKDGQTVLDMARANGSQEIITLLQSRGAK